MSNLVLQQYVVLDASTTAPLYPRQEISFSTGNNTKLFITDYLQNTSKIRCVLKTKGQGDLVWRNRLKQECSILQRLQNIKYIPITYGYQDELRYENTATLQQTTLPQYGILMEDLSSYISLQEWYKQTEYKHVSLHQKLIVMKRICKAVHLFHQQSVFHKYLNPSHILIQVSTLKIKIIDFTHASIWKQEKIHSLGIEQDLNDKEKLDKLLYEMQYWSPELTGKMNRLVDFRTDFYSLGIVFYELLSGKVPFESEDLLQIIYSHIAKKPKEIEKQDIPEHVCQVVMKLIEKNPETRYHSALSLLFDLKNCLKQYSHFDQIVPFELDVHGRESTFMLKHKIYAREEELGMLLNSFGKVSQGSLEVVIVEGYSGVGKSSLINELYRPLVQAKGYFISGKQEQMKSNIPFFSLKQAIKQFIQMVLTENKTRVAYWKKLISEAVSPNGKLLIDVVSDLELLIGEQASIADLNGNESTNRFVYAFTNLIASIASKDHPLIFFLDDLQWADQASLKVFCSLANSQVIKYFMLIGSYRDNEVSDTHILTEALRKITTPITKIKLQPLKIENIVTLVKDSFGASVEREMELCKIVMQKTEGNPFFSQILLTGLFEENVVWFDHNSRIWKWSTENLLSKQISENVVEVMISYILRLDKRIQALLSKAALIGTKFDIPNLSYVANMSETDCLTLLKSVTDRNLLLLERVKEDTVVMRFAHDKIQQASFNLISAEERKETHLKLGIKLREDISNGNIFVVVNHLNSAIDLINEEEARIELGRLNMRAAMKAKRAVAFSVSASLSKFAIEKCLPKNSWEREDLYELIYELYCMNLETEYLSENYQPLEVYFEVIEKVKSSAEKVRVYSIMLTQLEAESKFQLLLEHAIDILSKFDIQLSLDENYVNELVKKEYFEMAQIFKGKTKSDILNMKELEDSFEIGLMELIQKALAGAFILCQPLYRYMCILITKKTLQHGKCIVSPFGILSVGLLFGEYTKNFTLGKELCNAAMDMAFAYNDQSFIAKNAIFYGTSYSNMLDVAVNISVLEKGYEAAISNGNFLDASYCCVNIFGMRLYSGVPLDELESMNRPLLNFINKYSPAFRDIVSCSETLIQRLQNPEKIELNLEEYLKKYEGQAFYELSYYICKLYEYYYFEEPMSDKVAKVIEKIYEAVPIYYSSTFSGIDVKVILSLLMLRYNMTEKVSFIQETMKQLELFSKLCPSNYSYRYLILKGEYELKIEKQALRGLEYFYESISEALKYSKISYAAMSHEHIMRLWISLQKDSYAAMHLKHCLELYETWKAEAKVIHLRENYFGKLARANPSYFAGFLAMSSQLNTQAVVKASQAISSEVDLSKLLNNIMKIIVEGSLSEKALLLIKDEGKLVVVAQAQCNPFILNQETISFSNFENCPKTVIQYVEESKNTFIHGNALYSSFKSDNYIIQNEVKSILCIPLIRYKEVQGVIYLENNLSFHAFSNDTSELMNLLSNQILISLQNAISFKEKIRVAQEAAAEKAKQKEAEEYKQRINEFVDSICHEIRNPLFGCFANVEFIFENLNSISQYQEQHKTLPKIVMDMVDAMYGYADSILKCCTHEKVIIDDTLNLSKIEANQLELNIGCFKPMELVKNVLQMLRPLIAKEKLYLKSTFPNMNDLILKADPDRIRQVLINLLSNSIKFTHTGGITVEVLLEEKSENEKLVMMMTIKVSDTGIGISEEEQQRIFNRFQQANSSISKNYGGSGLGLPLCKKLLQLMSGDILVESEVGKGSTFTVWIPCEIATTKEQDTYHASVLSSNSFAMEPQNQRLSVFNILEEQLQAAGKLSYSTQSQPKQENAVVPVVNHEIIQEKSFALVMKEMKILIVEDNIINQKVLQRYISQAGYQTDICNDGIEAIETITKGDNNYSICFMDIQMPRCSGIDTTKAIRKWEQEMGRKNPIIIIGLSGYARKEYVDLAIEAGMNEYITKPFDKKTIFVTISKYIQ